MLFVGVQASTQNGGLLGRRRRLIMMIFKQAVRTLISTWRYKRVRLAQAQRMRTGWRTWLWETTRILGVLSQMPDAQGAGQVPGTSSVVNCVQRTRSRYRTGHGREESGVASCCMN